MPRLPDASALGARQAPRPTGRIVVDRSGEILGEGVAKFGATVAAVAGKMQEDRDADVLFRTEAEMKDEYLKWEAEATKRRGMNAWGVSTEADEWWTKAREKYGAKLENNFQRKALEKSIIGLRMSSTNSLRKYEGEQQRAARTDSAKASITTSIDIAAAHHDDSEAVAQARKDVADRIDVIGDLEGWTPEQRALEKSTAQSRLHAQVIKAKIEKDPAGAKAYYDANKHEILGTQQADIEKVVNAGTIREKSQAVGDTMRAKGFGLSEGLRYIRENFSGELEDDLVSRWKTHISEQETAKNLNERVVARKLWDLVEAGTPYEGLPTGLLSQASPEIRRGLRLDSEERAAGRDVKTDMKVYGELVSLPPDEFKDVPLENYFGKLSPGDRKSLLDRQAKVKNGDLDTLTENRQIERYAEELKLDKKDEKYGLFRRQAEDAVASFTQSNGRKPNQKERQQILDDLVLEGKVDGRVFDSSARRFEVLGTPDEARFTESPEAAYASVPQSDREKIIDALNEAGKPVSEATIVYYYRKKLGLAK